MKTSNLVGVSADRSAQYIVGYNLQDEKTEGSWRGMTPMNQDELVSFHGGSNMPGLSIQQKGNLLKSQIYSSAQTNRRLRKDHSTHKNWAECHTIIQSFEYSPNPDLSPATVHQMGNQLYRSVQLYMKDRYNYDLEGGLVSTHIDRDQDVFNSHSPTNKIRHPHLHNHIVLPAYNSQGKSVSAYLRKDDIYNFQQMNDAIVSDHGLNDYYFSKLRRQLYPFSAYAQNEYGRHKELHPVTRSNLQHAWHAFKEANDYAWDKNRPMKRNHIDKKTFNKTLKDRDDYLRIKFHFRTRTKKDTRTHKKKPVFTMDGLRQPTNMRNQWYNINNMRILRWRNRREMRTERLLWQFNFKGLLNKSVSFHDYNQTVQYATNKIPSIGKIVKPNLRQRFQIHLASAYRHVEKAMKVAKKQVRHARIKMSEKYKKYSQYGKRLMRSFDDLDNRMTHRHYKSGKVNFLVQGINASINRAYTHRIKKTQKRQVQHVTRTRSQIKKGQNARNRQTSRKPERTARDKGYNGMNLD